MSREFDKNQKTAITTIDGPVLCIAGPGSGKTTVIVNRTLHMVKSGIDPESIIVMTFTRDAAEEMYKRYQSLKGSVPGPLFCTIHSFSYKVCRDVFGDTLRVLQNSDAIKFFRNYFSKHLSGGYYRDVRKAILNIIADIGRYTLSEDKESFEPDSCTKEELLRAYVAYTQFKREYSLLDFNDMILFCYKLLQDEDVCSRYQEKYKYIMVDEFQDTSRVQADILNMIAAKYRNLFICGDDDQSIYGFRNANPKIMLDFPNKYPDCTTVKLSTNYRSEQSIVEGSKSLIKNNNARFKKDISGNKQEKGLLNVKEVNTDKIQKKDIISNIRSLSQKSGYKEIAILCRTNKEISKMAKLLSDNEIPFNVREQVENIHDTWVFETIYTYLKIAYEVNDNEDIMRIANRPSRYIKGDAIKASGGDIRRLKNLVERRSLHNVIDLEDDIKQIRYYTNQFIPFCESARKIINYLRIEDWIKSFCKFLNVDESEYLDIFEECLTELEDFTEKGRAGFEQFDKYVGTDDKKFKDNIQNQSEDGVTIATIHRSKGREWDHVIVTSVNNGNIPYARKEIGEREDVNCIKAVGDLEEERRLFYVAITRARVSCDIYYIRNPLEARKNKPNNTSRGAKSIFIHEIGA